VWVRGVRVRVSSFIIEGKICTKCHFSMAKPCNDSKSLVATVIYKNAFLFLELQAFDFMDCSQQKAHGWPAERNVAIIFK
jgi:hypothetical protein